MNPNAYNTRRPLVNLRVGKCSHFILFDDHGRFGAGTNVASAKDNTNGLTWKGDALWSQSTANALKIRLKRKATSGPSAAAAATTSGGPDSGDISITLTDPNIPVDDITVDYVDDNETSP